MGLVELGHPQGKRGQALERRKEFLLLAPAVPLARVGDDGAQHAGVPEDA